MELIKTVFLGIDNAGKSTIINILSKQYSLVSNLVPTKSVQRHKTEAFGYEVINWDIPGQKTFREEVTFKTAVTLENVNILIFTVDVQDIEHTDVALNYFERVLELVKEKNETLPKIGVLIHKMDPDIRKDIKILKNAKKIQDKLTELASGFTIDFFLTTMFVESTILIGFSTVFRKVVSKKKQDTLATAIHHYADELLLNAILLIDKNNFILSHYGRDTEDLKILEAFVYNLITSYRNAISYNLGGTELKLSLEKLNLLLMPISIHNHEILVVGSSHEPDVSLVPLKEHLTNALQDAYKD